MQDMIFGGAVLGILTDFYFSCNVNVVFFWNSVNL